MNEVLKKLVAETTGRDGMDVTGGEPGTIRGHDSIHIIAQRLWLEVAGAVGVFTLALVH